MSQEYHAGRRYSNLGFILEKGLRQTGKSFSPSLAGKIEVENRQPVATIGWNSFVPRGPDINL